MASATTLYHGTYAHRVPSIMASGLVPGGAPANWRESDPRCVYLAADAGMAGFLAGIAERVESDWEVVVIEVRLPGGEAGRLRRDACVPEAPDLFQVEGAIAPERLSLAAGYRP